MIRFTTREQLPLAAGPLDFDAIVRNGIAQTEVQPGIVLRKETRAGLHFTGEAPAAHINVRTRSNRVAITFHADAAHQQPAFLWTIILQETGAGAEVANHEFHGSVVVQIAGGGAPRRPRVTDASTGFAGQIH